MLVAEPGALVVVQELRAPRVVGLGAGLILGVCRCDERRAGARNGEADQFLVCLGIMHWVSYVFLGAAVWYQVRCVAEFFNLSGNDWKRFHLSCLNLMFTKKNCQRVILVFEESAWHTQH